MKNFFGGGVCGCVFLAFFCFFFCSSLDAKSPMSDADYQQALDYQAEYHNFLREADRWERHRDYGRAVFFHEKAFRMAQGSSLEPVSRGELARLYELDGQYEKALGEIDWFLVKSNKSSPLWDKFVDSRQRLLQKIEAQKRETEPMASTSDTQLPPIKNIADFTKASYSDQKRYMEEKLPENTAILKLSKQAMLAEHAGDFKSAKESYEALLAQERAVTAAQGEVAWVMLHCAVQRTSEVTGDEVREKEMLVWIRDCMLVPDGQHHKYLNGLMPSVQDHLKERLRKFGLTS